MAYPSLVQDVRGYILGVLSVGDHSLRNWDGKNWVEHPLPRAFRVERLGRLATDSLHRVWLLPDPWGETVAIFYPVRGTFEAYLSYPAALEAQLANRQNFSLNSDHSGPSPR